MDIRPELIGFDFDGVIGDIGEAFIRLACENYNFCSLKIDEITSFEVEKCTAIPETIVQKIFSELLEDSVATGLLPISGAIEGLTALAHQSEITIITARSLANPVIDWLDKYLPPYVCSRIHLFAMSDHNEKVRYIQNENLHYFVDDRAETCLQIAEAGLVPLLFRQPWNENWNGYAIVENWQNIMDMIAADKA